MALWKKLWLLFTVMWVVVAGLNVMTILVFSDEIEHAKALWPAAFGVGVPLFLYGIGTAWDLLRRKK